MPERKTEFHKVDGKYVEITIGSDISVEIDFAHYTVKLNVPEGTAVKVHPQTP